jgi:bis(5'-nucleosyl)-tetraphosphatase (symmetrical)
VNYERFIVIGDVHGCLDELKELLKVVEYRRNDKDCLVFAGDLVDRGPDPVGVVRLARELGASCAMGNHEEKHIRWRTWENRIKAGEAKKNPMRRFDEQRMREHEALSEDDMNYLMAMPKTVTLGHEQPSWLVVHAGFECNGVRYDHQSRDTVCRVRNVDETGKMASNPKNPLIDVPGSVPWAERWYGPENVIYGHAVHSREAPKVDLHDGYGCYGIDTGCVFGGRLTALVLVDRSAPTFAQVQAKREYYPWSRNNAGND